MAKKSAAKKSVAAAATTVVFEEEVMAKAVADYMDDKKAENIKILDVRGLSPVANYFVICTASSMPHLKAVRDEVQGMMFKDHNVRPIAKDENLESLWIILHYGDVMAHVFHEEKRSFYALEDLWNDAKRVEWKPQRPPVQAVVKKALVAEAPAKKAPAKKTAAKKVAAKKATKKTKD
jgi:ribosome-associated protein